MKRNNDTSGASFEAREVSGNLRVFFSGRLDAAGVSSLWNDVLRRIDGTRGRIVLDCESLKYLDGAGAALLTMIRHKVEGAGGSVVLANITDDQRSVLGLTWECEPARWSDKDPDRRDGIFAIAGRMTVDILKDLVETLSFTGELIVTACGCIFVPGRLRYKDFLLSVIRVGFDSLPIIILIGFLMGLIMSFQSAITLMRFGAEIFVPNMLGLVMFREMGPLVTAILLAARSGSAFAAEIGTMKINEEVDALTTMGLSPMRFLVVPKVLAAVVAVPFMTMFFNFASLVGGAIVMLSMKYPLVTFTSRVFSNVRYMDFVGGLMKALTFSVLVAAVGCLRGLNTKTGASSVGLSTTSAVVSGIILIAVADGIFAVAFYFLGL